MFKIFFTLGMVASLEQIMLPVQSVHRHSVGAIAAKAYTNARVQVPHVALASMICNYHSVARLHATYRARLHASCLYLAAQ